MVEATSVEWIEQVMRTTVLPSAISFAASPAGVRRGGKPRLDVAVTIEIFQCFGGCDRGSDERPSADALSEDIDADTIARFREGFEIADDLLPLNEFSVRAHGVAKTDSRRRWFRRGHPAGERGCQHEATDPQTGHGKIQYAQRHRLAPTVNPAPTAAKSTRSPFCSLPVSSASSVPAEWWLLSIAEAIDIDDHILNSEPLRGRADDALVRLMRNQQLDVVRGKAVAIEQLPTDIMHFADSERKTCCPSCFT